MAPTGKRNIRTDAQLIGEGYFHVHTKRCSYHPCTSQIEVWRTKNQKLMPFDRLQLTAQEAKDFNLPTLGSSQAFISCLEPHFASCQGLAARREAKAAGEHQEQEPEAGQ